ncbi:MAG TPA: M20/M25/M40 family metallo-hydrolase [Chthoniobacteraceae bacterium]|nr:M20/M25/M40 family metallo-hydrolase [Chthoniobacteraceae bacterium]
MTIPLLTRACETFWPETKGFLRELVEINSFSTNVRGVNRMGRRVAAQFRPMGFEAFFVPHGSADFGSHLVLKGPPAAGCATVGLIAHLDTVFSTKEETQNGFRWREEGSRIHGPGTNDMKGGIAMIFLVLSTLRAHLPKRFSSTNWVILCNACEETDSEDFGVVCRTHLPADTKACLIFEADGGNAEKFSLVTARKGRATFQLEVHGRGAHAGSQHARGANAIVQIGRVIEKMESRTNYERGLTVNVGTISGGVVMNRVPEVASAELEIRASSVEVFEEERKFLLSLNGYGDLSSRGSETHRCRIRVSQTDETSPWPRNAASENLFSLWKSAGRQMSRQVVAESRGGLSDGNVLWSHFPTLDGLGPEGDHAHCSENDPVEDKEQEFVETASFTAKAVLNIIALRKFLDPPKESAG